MRRIRRYTHANKKCQIIKYSKDTRYDSERASTHDLQKCDAIGCSKLSDLSEEQLERLDCIGIDEGQFFCPDVVEFADRWATRGKVVIVAALDATFERRPFGNILELIPLAEQVLKLNAVCMVCHRDASFTKRIGSETAVEVIGGADKYLSTCRTCFERSTDSPQTMTIQTIVTTTNVETSTPTTLSPVTSNDDLSPLTTSPLLLSKTFNSDDDGLDLSLPIPIHSTLTGGSKRVVCGGASGGGPLQVIDGNHEGIILSPSINRKRKEMNESNGGDAKRQQREKENLQTPIY